MALGTIAWVIALGFGIDRVYGVVTAASVGGADAVAAAVVLGFALAGGLCMLGAAVAGSCRHESPPRPRGKTDFDAVLDQLRFTGMLTNAEYDALKRKLAAKDPASDGA
jgi:hypothetical protein